MPTVSVGFVGTATYDVLPQVVREVQQELPDVDLQVRREMLSPQLKDGLHRRAFDLALLWPARDASAGSSVRRLRIERPVASMVTWPRWQTEGELPYPSWPGKRSCPSLWSPSSLHDPGLAACSAASFPPMVREVAEAPHLWSSLSAGSGLSGP